MKDLGRCFMLLSIVLLFFSTFLIYEHIRAEEKAGGVLPDAAFKITEFKFLQSENGPERAQSAYKPKDRVYTTFEFTGFGLDPQGRPHVLVEMSVSDPDGMLLFKPIKDDVHQEVKGKSPLGYLNVELPAYAAAGTYKVRIKARDAVKNSDFELVQPFDIDAPPVAVSKQLEFRDCRFSRAKDGPPVKPLAIKAGEKIYSSCKVAGMQFVEDKMDVRISLRVVGPAGVTIYETPDLITLKDPYFYRPASFFAEIYTWIGLPPDAGPGKYTWKYVMTDKIADTVTNYEEEFVVE
jgi:hypothetical protein